MLYRIYNLLSYLCMPFFFLYLVIKRKQHTNYTLNLRHRLGLIDTHDDRPIWIHGVSMGESVIAIRLALALIKKNPEQKIHLTSHTATSLEYIQQNPHPNITHTYWPYEASICVHTFLKRLRPTHLIIIETEIWPNIIRLCHKKQIPVIIANARISEHAFPKYQRIRTFLRQVGEYVTHILPQSHADAERFAAIGFPHDKIQTLGNIKADATPKEGCQEQGQALRKLWGKDRLMIIGASTHDTEEVFLLEAFAKVKEQHPDALLALAPRHPHRAETVKALAENCSFKTIFRTDLDQQQNHDYDVLVVNVMGEMWTFFAASDLTFVGGTIIELGGHNPIEPAKLAKPVANGPHVFNAVDSYKAIQESGGGITVHTPEELSKYWCELSNDAELRKSIGEKALASIKPMAGVLDKTVEIIFS